MIWTITLIQVTALTIAATRQTTRVLAEMDAGRSGARPAPSPSESDLNLTPRIPGYSGGEMDEPSW